MIPKSILVQAVATASSGYFAGNPTPKDEIASVILAITRALIESSGERLILVDHKPAVPIENSISAHAITCLECGKSMRSLKAHLRAAHALSAELYRRKWALPEAYPLMAPDASSLRSVKSREIQAKVQADPTIWKGGTRKRAIAT